jgi:hypothetical protein
VEPKLLTHLDKEWVWISLHVVRVPISVVLVSEDEFTVHEVFRCVCRLSVHIQSGKLLDVWFHDLWPGLTIVQVDTINAEFLGICNDLIDE